MKRIFSILFCLLTTATIAQDFHLLRSAGDHAFESEAMGKTMHYSVYVPLTMDVSEGIRYPVAFVFDRQNTRGCQNTVQAIDYLMASFAMPEFIVVTIEQEDRFYETSIDLDREGSGGIDSFLGFVLDELGDKMKTTYKANDYHLLIGHSRTAFLTTYALAKYPENVHAVVANSPFFIEPSNNPKIDLVDELASTFKKFEGTRYYSCSVGGEGRDPHFEYVTEAHKKMRAADFPSNFKWDGKEYWVADHYTVVGLHTMDALAKIYADFNDVLSRFIVEDDKAEKDVEWLKQQLNVVSEQYDMECTPQLVQVNSMASHFWQEKEYDKAIAFIELGLEYYPKETDLHGFAAMLYEESGNISKAKEHYEKALAFLNLSPWYTADEKTQSREELAAALKALE